MERMTRDEGTLVPLSYKAVHQNGGRAKWGPARSRSLCDGCLARNSTAEKLLIEACFRSPFSLFFSLSTYSQGGKYVNEALVPSCPVPSTFEKNTNHRRDTVVSLPNRVAMRRVSRTENT